MTTSSGSQSATPQSIPLPRQTHPGAGPSSELVGWASHQSSDHAAMMRLALPKGRMEDAVSRLLSEAGLRLTRTARDYRPAVSLPGWNVKILKPQAVVDMLHRGARDLGFAGGDWVRELEADVVELLDTGLDLVRLVVAAPAKLAPDGRLPNRPLAIASEYTRLTEQWRRSRGVTGRVIRSWGATEVLPPEDADLIVDNVATGATLEANSLRIIEEIGVSSTRLYASREAMSDSWRYGEIKRFTMLIRSVLEARRRVMLEVNVSAELLERVVEAMPCMREPTIAQLHGGSGYAVKAAVPRDQLATVIPRIREVGGTDIVVTEPIQIVP